jgi:hypothetical protein
LLFSSRSLPGVTVWPIICLIIIHQHLYRTFKAI